MRKKPFIPIWRDPAALANKRVPDWPIFVACAATFGLDVLPGFNSRGDYNVPVSFGLRDQDPQSWALWFSLVAVLVVEALYDLRSRRFVSGFVLGLIGVCLVVVAVTPPLSVGHLNAFSGVLLDIALWFLGAGVYLEEPGVAAFAIAILVASLVTMVMPGIGERLLVLTGIAGVLITHQHRAQQGEA